MAHIPKQQHPIEKLVDEVEFKQRNTTWPETMVNAKGVTNCFGKAPDESQRFSELALHSSVWLSSCVEFGSLAMST